MGAGNLTLNQSKGYDWQIDITYAFRLASNISTLSVRSPAMSIAATVSANGNRASVFTGTIRTSTANIASPLVSATDKTASSSIRLTFSLDA